MIQRAGLGFSKPACKLQSESENVSITHVNPLLVCPGRAHYLRNSLKCSHGCEGKKEGLAEIFFFFFLTEKDVAKSNLQLEAELIHYTKGKLRGF